MRGVVLIVLVLLLVSCGKNECRDSVAPTEVNLQVDRLEQELFSSTSEEELLEFLKRHPDISNLYRNISQLNNETQLANQLFSLIKNPSLDTLYQEAIKSFESDGNVIPQLESGYGRLKALFPQTQIPAIQTIVTGFAEKSDLIITNESVTIGLDFFVGEGGTYLPPEIPQYILRRYNTEHLPSIILQFVSSQYVKPGKGQSLLTEMIDLGKSYYLLSQILPCTPERILIGYTEQEWNDAKENDVIIWANFVENQILYETNHITKQKFLAERPNVYEIGDKCPGRIGAWVGWQIVNAYMEKSNSTIQQLMEQTDHNEIFRKSGYKPG